MTDEPWKRLAELVRARREDLRMSQQELGSAADTTDRLIRSIEKAERSSFNRGTLRAVVQALGWTADSADRILGGEDPIPAASDQAVQDRVDTLEREIAEIRRQLAEATGRDEGQSRKGA